jgi:DNA mismatch repair protein MutS
MARASTPLMQQYEHAKRQHPDALLLFRVGDFYETFGEDAIRAARILEITLTKRGNGSASEIELAGFPHHSLDTYLPRLVRAGQRVAICDQLEDPKLAKGLVKRGVTEVVTPGVTLHDDVLQAKANNFLCAVHWTRKELGIAFLDVSTGDFQAGQGDSDFAERVMRTFSPAEVVYQRGRENDVFGLVKTEAHRSRLEDWVFTEDSAMAAIEKQFGVASMKGFGLADSPLAAVAVGAILHYLDAMQHARRGHLRQVGRIAEEGVLWMDRFTFRNLEVLHPAAPGGRALVDAIDQTASPMGARMLRRWLMMPSTDLGQIQQRHDAVAALLAAPDALSALRDVFKRAGDMERLASKASTGRINPRELAQLRVGLRCVHDLASAVEGLDALLPFLEQLTPCDALLSRLERELADEPALAVSKGAVIRPGVFPELDALRNLRSNAHEALEAICVREAEHSGIPSLKVASNNVFGYYLEVRNAHKDKVPASWIRKQTLTQAERYITEELKELEERILDAQSRAESVEQRMYDELVVAVAAEIEALQANARVLARVDVLHGFARVARDHDYTRPELVADWGLRIEAGRHPVIEQSLPPGETYVANDVVLDPDLGQILMVTGPNMAGKSALLRQTALISLLAQAGSFVPANAARLGLCTRIFTRVGASDNISSGESTFMVEMNETASILNNLTERSLVLLDEIGRGTSTYDGVSIAWSIAEFLHEHPRFRPLTLFATHYHELNDMSAQFPRIQNFNVSVKQVGQHIVFLRKLVPGGSNHSFGIHVARLAGMPASVVQRAQEVLGTLEARREPGDAHAAEGGPHWQPAAHVAPSMQMSIFQLDDPVLEDVREQLLGLDIDHLTPVDALMKLHQIRNAVLGKTTV